MTTNPNTVQQLVRAHERDLLSAAEQSRLRRTAVAARRRRRRPFAWLRWHPTTARPAVARLSHEPSTQIAR